MVERRPEQHEEQRVRQLEAMEEEIALKKGYKKWLK